jgi:competence protein ComEC
MKMRIINFIFLLLTFSAGNSTAANDPLSIYFVNVGQGNATFFHQPGKCDMLIDAGPASQGESLREVLQKSGVKTLDYVVITHLDPDHYVGLQIILSDIKIKELSDNGDPGKDSEGFADYRELQSELPYSVLAAGDSWQCGDLNIDVLHPSATFAGDAKDANIRSLVLRVSYNSFKLLIMGDLTGKGEQELLKGKENLQAMVMEVAHHGAADTTSSALLERVKPQLAVISVGKVNSIGAPAAGVLQRLADYDVHTFRTDQNGTIQLRVQADGSIRLTM